MENLSADKLSPSRFHRTTREHTSARQRSGTILLRLLGRVDLRGGSVLRVRLRVKRRPEEGTDGVDDGDDGCAYRKREDDQREWDTANPEREVQRNPPSKVSAIPLTTMKLLMV